MHIEPEISAGTPAVRGKRVPVQSLFDYLELGGPIEQFLDQFPSVSKERALAALRLAPTPFWPLRVLLDENLPRALATVLTENQGITVQAKGWPGTRNALPRHRIKNDAVTGRAGANGSAGPRSMLSFEYLAPTIAASVMWVLLASCDLGPKTPTYQTNPSSLQALHAIRPAGPRASPRIRLLRRSIKAGESSAKRFWEEVEQQGTPLIERIPNDQQHSLVTFLWRAADDTHNVAVVGEVLNGAEPAMNQMFHVKGSDVWYLSFAIRNDARFTYAFSPDDSMLPLLDPARVSVDFRQDPLNPRRFLGLSGKYSSYVELPDARSEPWKTPAPDTARDRLARTSFRSSLLGNERALWIYTPAPFDPDRRDYPLLVLLDGGAYTHSSAPAAAILDHLIATKQIPPILAILVGNTHRVTELPSSTFAAFLATELALWATENYGATQDPANIAIAGSSLGGLVASFAGFQHPDVFGNVLSMSGSYWWEWGNQEEPEWLTRQFEETPRKPVRFFVAVGAMEKVDSQLATNRRFANALAERGYPVEYQEFNGGHGYLSWRRALLDGLVTLFGEEGG